MVAAVLDFVAFPGIGVWPVAFVALVPLMFALDGEPRHSGRRALLIAAVFAVVANLGGFYWLIEMLETFSGFPLVLCVLFASLLCLFQGGQLILFALLWFRARGRGWGALLAAPAAFAASELVYPILFQFFHGNHLHAVPELIQIAELGGPILVSVLIIAVNTAIYEVASALVHRQRPRLVGPGIVAAGLVATLIYGVVRIGQVDAWAAGAPALSVGIVQVNMGIFAKREDPVEGLRRHIEQSRQLEEQVHPDLLIWPESAYTFFLPDGVDNVQQYVTGPLRTPLLFGGLARRRVGGADRHYNTAFLADEHGQILGTYDKTYLLAFGEYLPLGETFPELYEMSPHSGHFTPGDHVRPVVFRGHRITALICYEDILPGFVRRAVNEGDSDLLVNMTNDSWFGDTTEPWQHLALAQFRSIEHRRYMIRATNSGVSAIIDPVGRVVARTGVLTRENLHGDVRLMSGWTPYETFGDWPGWVGLAAITWMAFVRRRSAAS